MPYLDQTAIANALAVLALGGSLHDAADYINVSRSTLRRLRDNDPEFASLVRQAVARAQVRHLTKLDKATNWQAAAFFLERRRPERFARPPKGARSAAPRRIIRMRRIVRGPESQNALPGAP